MHFLIFIGYHCYSWSHEYIYSRSKIRKKYFGLQRLVNLHKKSNPTSNKVFGHKSTVFKWNHKDPVIPCKHLQCTFWQFYLWTTSLLKSCPFFLANCQRMDSQNLAVFFDYSWFLAQNLAFWDPDSLLGKK